MHHKHTHISHLCRKKERKKERNSCGFRQTKLRMINTIKTSVKTVPMINLYCSFMFRTKHLWLFLMLLLCVSARALVEFGWAFCFNTWTSRIASVPLLLCFVCVVFCFQFYVLSFLDSHLKVSESKATAYYSMSMFALFHERAHSHTWTHKQLLFDCIIAFIGSS